MKIYILLDIGCGETEIWGVTSCKQAAEDWEKCHRDNAYKELDLMEDMQQYIEWLKTT